MNKIRRGYKVKFDDGHIEYITDVFWVHWIEKGKKHKRICVCTENVFDIDLLNKIIITNFK